MDHSWPHVLGATVCPVKKTTIGELFRRFFHIIFPTGFWIQIMIYIAKLITNVRNLSLNFPLRAYLPVVESDPAYTIH